MEGKDSLTVDLARRDFEREISECYKGYVVKSRLKRVPNEDVKCNALTHEEEVRRFLSRYIESVKSPDGHVLQSNHDMHEAFRVHFRGPLARCLDLPVQEFRSYLADFPRLQKAEATRYEDLVTECGVRDALKKSRHQQIARTIWFVRRSVLEAAALF